MDNTETIPMVTISNPKVAAGLVMYRFGSDNQLQVFLVHPGGPIWEKQDIGAWSIPKGEVGEFDAGLLATAVREFVEETGFFPDRPFIDLGKITQKSGKVVHAWAFEDRENNDPKNLICNLIEIDHPKGSGNKITIPEVDRGEYFDLAMATNKINPRQVPLLLNLFQELLTKQAINELDKDPSSDIISS